MLKRWLNIEDDPEVINEEIKLLEKLEYNQNELQNENEANTNKQDNYDEDEADDIQKQEKKCSDPSVLAREIYGSLGVLQEKLKEICDDVLLDLLTQTKNYMMTKYRLS